MSACLSQMPPHPVEQLLHKLLYFGKLTLWYGDGHVPDVKLEANLYDHLSLGKKNVLSLLKAQLLKEALEFGEVAICLIL